MENRILITAAAGFIGYHLALALKRRGDFVMCNDHFNAYYDPALKKARAEKLALQEIPVFTGDICTTALLRQTLQENQISHVVHLAAQAGVRHSLSAPNEYVSSNLQGFVSLLEACRLFPSLKITYASSSSVYGNNRKLPFSPEDQTD